MTTIQIIMLPITCAAAIVAVAGAVVTWRAARQLRIKQHTVPYTPPPRERCGDLAPQILEHCPRVECVLRPGHQGSHANERGARWWYDPTQTEEQPGA